MFLESLMPDTAKLQQFAFLWEIGLVLVSVLVAGYLSRRANQPAVFGQLLAGVILGPAVLGWLHPSPLLKELSEVGVILLMFLAGLETDVSEFRRNAGAATLVAVLGVVLPFIGGWLLAGLHGYPTPTAIFTGTLLVATSVSISVQTLRELGRLRSREGVTILGAAVLDDVLGILVLSLVLGFLSAGEGSGLGSLAGLLVRIAIFFVVAGAVGRYLLPGLLRWFDRFPLPAARQGAAIACALFFAFTAEAFGLAGIVGAYLAGLTLSAAGGQEELYHDLEKTAFAFLVPFFFVGVGLSVQLSGLAGEGLGFIVVLSLLAILTKVVGCGLGALLSRFPLRSALGVGAGMVARGEVGLIVAAIGLDRQLIGPELFTAMVIVVLVTTLVTPPLLKLVFRDGAGAPSGAAGREA
ncbi:MAG: cation:proton antiporter [Bacillota bacterium]